MGMCWWLWDGTEWYQVTQNCDPGKVCSPPGFDGTYVNEPATTPCA